jgi:hypothetical protein
MMDGVNSGDNPGAFVQFNTGLVRNLGQDFILSVLRILLANRTSDHKTHREKKTSVN